MKDQLPYVGGIRFTPAAASPLATGQTGFYVKSADGLAYFRKADGTETAWGAGGGGSSYYQTVKNAAGTAQTQRSFLQFGTGLTVTDDGTNTVVAASGGGGSFDATAPYTFTGLHTHAANITFDGDTRSIGDATHRAANVYALALKSGASPLLIKGDVASATQTNPAVYFDATATSGVVYSWRAGGTTLMNIDATGSNAVYLEFGLNAAWGYFLCGGSAASTWYFPLGVVYNSPSVTPFSTNISNLGGSNAWKYVTSYQYRGIVQTVTATTAALTIDPTAGETVRVSLTGTAGTNPASVTFSPGQPGQILRVEWIQDATGGKTFPSSGNFTGIRLKAGEYSVTATANLRDIWLLMWDSVDNLWFQLSRTTGV